MSATDNSMSMPWSALVNVVQYIRHTEGDMAASAAVDAFCKELRGTEDFDEAGFIRDCRYVPSPYHE